MINKQAGFIPLLAIIIIAVVAIGGGVAVYKNSNKNAEVDTSTEVSTETNVETETSVDANAQVSIKDLLALGKSQKCTFSSTVENSSSEGVVYIANGKMRGDFSSSASGTTMKSHMISDGTDVSVWMDSMNQGFKMKANATAQAQSQTKSSAPDMDQKLDYDCSAWSADNFVFVAPSNITFTNMTNVTIPKIDAGIKTDVNVSY